MSNRLDRETVSILTAMAITGVSRRTVYNWIAAGKVEYVRTPGGRIRIFADTLLQRPGLKPMDAAATDPPAC